jgi:CHAT domain-containing protein
MPYHSRLVRWILPGVIHALGVLLCVQSPGTAQTVADPALAAYTSGEYRSAIAQWQQMLSLPPDRSTRIQLHTNLAKAHQQLGQFDRALDHWKQAIELSRTPPQPQSSQSSQSSQSQSTQSTIALFLEAAQSYDRLGQPRRALEQTTAAQTLLKTHPNPALSAAAQGIQAQSLMALGELDTAIEHFTQAVQTLAASPPTAKIAAALWNNLGNAHTRRRDRDTQNAIAATEEGNLSEAKRFQQSATRDEQLARQAYAQSSRLAQDPIAQITPRVNAQVAGLQPFLLTRLNPAPVNPASVNPEQTLTDLPPSRTKIYALLALTPTLNLTPAAAQIAEKRIRQAIDTAQQIGDLHTLSYALGILGHLYETQSDRDRALDYTQRALNTAQQIRALDSLYRWQWQMGRILAAPPAPSSSSSDPRTDMARRVPPPRHTPPPIAHYRDAIATLQTLRTDLLANPRDRQLDLRDAVDPLYRELIALLVAQPTQANLTEAIDTLERLKLIELQNFYGDDCIQILQETLPPELLKSRRTHAPTLPQLKPGTIALYTIILKTETLLILQRPSGELQLHRIAIPETQLQSQMQRLRYTLEDISLERYRIESARAYDLLIRPIAAQLQADPTLKTLIFVNDGVLRNIPMGALYDGKQFLIEKHAIAITLSLYLTNTRKLKNPQRTLIFGLTNPVAPFSPLPQVAEETETIQAITQGTRFLDRDFTLDRLTQELQNKDYGTLHLATHGRFGSDTKNTFLVTHDGRITLDQIESILRQNRRSLSLLILSACETATGNDRAALGMAGVAIRTGVQSTIATLWFINDAETVPLITEFYRQRQQQPSLSKAEALRQAQLKMLADPQTQHPALWAAFTLIGNWE